MRIATFSALVLGVVLAACSSDSVGSDYDASPTPSSRDASPPTDARVSDSAGDAGAPTEVAETLPSIDAARESAVDDAGPPLACMERVAGGCDIIQQDCPGNATCTCDDSSTGHAVCVDRVVGKLVEGDGCSSPEECSRGLLCLAQHCTRACRKGDDSACGPSGTCGLAVTGAPDGGVSNVVLYACKYAQRCHPFAFDCPSGQVCIWGSGIAWCVFPTIASSGLGTAPGGPCSTSLDCGESQTCYRTRENNGGPGQCALLCQAEGTEVIDGGLPEGRFPANGTCVVASQRLGRCETVADISGGLGICRP